jgi:methionine-gamma-lyase
MRAHEENALAVAKFLEEHRRVRRVVYPGLASHPQHDLARKQMRNFSGMMTFQPERDGAEIAKRMIERFEVIHYSVSLGHHRSLIYWIPTDALMASSFKLEGEALKRYRKYAGDGVFRFSVGIEDAQDICADLDKVLA